MNYLLSKQFIPERAHSHIKEHKYRGGSDSILYSFLWSPLTQFMCDHIFPSWLAPNVITLTGFFGLIIGCGLSLYYSPDFGSPIPTWVLYFDFAAVLNYQILDNADGKQARKTQSSSPLGMLFDHGCDTLASGVITMILSNAIWLGSSKILIFCVFNSSFVGFFLAMWQQYQIGEMRLAYINAIDEGLVYIESMILIAAVLGQSWWLQTVNIFGYDIQYNHLQIYCSIIFTLGSDISFIYPVFAKDTRYSKRQILASLSPNIFLAISVLVVYFYSETSLMFTCLAREIIFNTFLWSKLTGSLQLCNITREKFDPFQAWYLFLIFIQPINCYFRLGIDEVQLLNVLLYISAVVYLHWAFSVANHLAQILDIKIFKIKKIKV